jgi:hypothetical protein
MVAGTGHRTEAWPHFSFSFANTVLFIEPEQAHKVRLWSTAKGTARRPGRTFSFSLGEHRLID